MHGNAAPPTTLKLALYQPWIYLHGGLERSILELVTRSRHEWTIYTGYYDPAGTFPAFSGLDVRALRPTTINRNMLSVLKSVFQVIRQKLPLHPDMDAVVVWCDGVGDMVTFRNRSLPLFNICSTPLRAVFDSSYQAQAMRKLGPLKRVAYTMFSHAFRTADRLAWKNYTGVVATSQEVKNRIISGGLYDDSGMVLAYPGVDWTPELGDVGYEPLILVSGRIMWTKNIELAVEAYIAARLPAPWKLVIAGFVDKKSAKYLAKLQALAAGREDIVFVVSPSDEELRDLLRRASFTLFTPLNEDWGIAPLEAMAQGKPVIAVNSGGPCESIVDGYSGFLLPPVVSQWAARIAALAEDPALVRQLGAQAHRHVERFTWARFAAAVDTALDKWMTRQAIP